MLMLGNLGGQCKRGRRSSPADYGAAEAFERDAQGRVANAVEPAVERLRLGGQQRAGWGWRRMLRQGRRSLDEGDPGHRAITEIAVDAFEKDRLAVLDFEGQRRRDAQSQRAVTPLAAPEGQLDRPALAGPAFARHGRP